MSEKTQVVQQRYVQIKWPDVGEGDQPNWREERRAIENAFSDLQQKTWRDSVAADDKVQAGLAGQTDFFVAATSGGAVTTPMRSLDGIITSTSATIPATRPNNPHVSPTNIPGRPSKLPD